MSVPFGTANNSKLLKKKSTVYQAGWIQESIRPHCSLDTNNLIFHEKGTGSKFYLCLSVMGMKNFDNQFHSFLVKIPRFVIS